MLQARLIRVWRVLLSALVVWGLLAGGPLGAQEPQPETELSGDLAPPQITDADRLEQAATALDEGRAAYAIDIIRPILDKTPQRQEARGLLAVAHLMNGETDVGCELLDSLPEEPASFRALARAVVVLEMTGAPEELITERRLRALKLANLATQQEIDDPAPYLFIATMASRIKDYAEMRWSTKLLTQKFPEESQGHLLAALVATHDGDWERQRTELLEAERLGADPVLVQQARDEAAAARAAEESARRWQYLIIGGVAAMIALWLWTRRRGSAELFSEGTE